MPLLLAARTAPLATYRLQLRRELTFDDAARLVPQLAALGVSHLYASPILASVPGSPHGYDVVDHDRLDDDLGGAEGYQRLVDALQRHELGLVIDTVPNHMALAGSANRWWWDVLEDGPASRWAGHFDIDWGDDPSVLMPVLDDHYGRALEAGALDLRWTDGSMRVTHHDHELPISPRSTDELLRAAAERVGSMGLEHLALDLGALPHAADPDPAARAERHQRKEELRRRLADLLARDHMVADAVQAETAAVAADADRLDGLLDRQNYRLAHWRTASEELDYRRFFDITSLVGLRVEDPQVFHDTHHLLLDRLAEDTATGLRIDHIDGLRDPAGYLARLVAAAPDAYIAVEKILDVGEELPAWPVAGTSGYDFAVLANGLFVDDRHEEALTALYQQVSGLDATFEEVAVESQHRVVARELASEAERLVDLLEEACRPRRRHRDHTRRALREALREVAVAFPVYRSYVVPGQTPSATDRRQVEEALTVAAERRPELDAELLTLLGRILLLEEPGAAETELAVRFQQLTAPAMAKGIEDTAFYRYHRLVSLNEVGGHPATFGTSPDAFHRHNERIAASWPATMLTLSTHDTKRSADVRARIDALSEVPQAWARAVTRWVALNERHWGTCEPDRNAEYLLYQTLVGAWPIAADRLQAFMAKAANEAKVHTSWTEPDPAYDTALAAFVAAVTDDRAFVADLERFLEESNVVTAGRTTSLALTTLLLTSPGVPDLYQGSELWDLSLVDPDNRRPVDHGRRGELLAELQHADPAVAMASHEEGGSKLWLTHRLLQHRRAHPAVYRGQHYQGLTATGAGARHVVAFERGDLVVAVPRCLLGRDGDGWGDTAVEVPPGPWIDVLSGRQLPGGATPVAELLEAFPVAVLGRPTSEGRS
ncbi:MAG: malto-oligosyltrehalose synthase [Acidimicrobiales bacterium]